MPKMVHAIAHFDFDGTCASCPLSHSVGFLVICRLSKTNFDLGMVLHNERHELCPLCIDEE